MPAKRALVKELVMMSATALSSGGCAWSEAANGYCATVR